MGSEEKTGRGWDAAEGARRLLPRGWGATGVGPPCSTAGRWEGALGALGALGAGRKKQQGAW